MKCFIGIDLGSTTTKAVLMDENMEVMGQGITNSRSNYDTAGTGRKQRSSFYIKLIKGRIQCLLYRITYIFKTITGDKAFTGDPQVFQLFAELLKTEVPL